MKNAALIRNMFALTQDEMARLLGITRTLWSMYEIGQRELPSSALLKLAAVTSHLHNAKQPFDERQQFIKAEQEKTQEWLKQKKSNMEYKKLCIERTILAMENKRAQCFAALDVVSFLEAENEQNSFPSLSSDIAARAKSTLHKNALHNLEDLYLKMEYLDYQIKSLKEKIK